MPRGKKSTAEQIIGTLREAEVEFAHGKTLPAVVRERCMTEQTHYRWRREYGGLRTDQTKRRQAIKYVRHTLNRDDRCRNAVDRTALLPSDMRRGCVAGEGMPLAGLFRVPVERWPLRLRCRERHGTALH